ESNTPKAIVALPVARLAHQAVPTPLLQSPAQIGIRLADVYSVVFGHAGGDLRGIYIAFEQLPDETRRRVHHEHAVAPSARDHQPIIEWMAAFGAATAPIASSATLAALDIRRTINTTVR